MALNERISVCRTKYNEHPVGGDPRAGTQFEQLVQKVMEEDGDAASLTWRHPLLTHSKEPLTSPLTTFTSETLQAEALKLFKVSSQVSTLSRQFQVFLLFQSVQLFMSVVLDSSGIDYHVVLAQNAIQQCLDVVELQPELLSALIKQTSKHGMPMRNSQSRAFKHPKSFLMNATNLFSSDCSPSRQSGLSSVSSHVTPTDSKSNPPNTVFIQVRTTTNDRLLLTDQL